MIRPGKGVRPILAAALTGVVYSLTPVPAASAQPPRHLPPASGPRLALLLPPLPIPHPAPKSEEIFHHEGHEGHEV
jgi:hypothetical protein